MKETYIPKGVCATQIDYEVKDGIVHDVAFTKGCNGNLKAIGKLVEGMPAEKVIEILKGNQCGNKGTSCADQLAKALQESLDRQQDAEQ